MSQPNYEPGYRPRDDNDLWREVMQIKEALATVISEIRQLRAAQDNHNGLPDRMMRLETRMDEQEKRAASNRWLIMATISGLALLLTLIGTHVSWK